jgi:chromosome partitioning protein
MHTIAVLNQKGGSGKSTVTECLAVAAVQDGRATGVLDMDPQGSVAAWKARRGDDDPAVMAVSQAELDDALVHLDAAGADLVLIDTPARLSDAAMHASRRADLVIVPSKPTVKDLERVEASIKLASSYGVKPTFVVLTQVRPSGPRNEQAEAFVREKDYPVCSARLGFRVAYEDADTLGRTPGETEPGGKAAAEITQLYGYTSALLQQIRSG